MKDFIFHFDSGGWNTVMADTLAEAKAKVKAEYGDHPRLRPNMRSVQVIAPEELRRWYSFFD